MTTISSHKPVFFYILIRSWKAFPYFDRCIESVLHQTYKKYQILFVDDNSGYTKQQKDYIRNKLKNHIVVFNNMRKYSVRNAYELIKSYAVKNEAVVVNLDGDDWLYSKSALQIISDTYRKTSCFLTYGNCYIWDGKTDRLPQDDPGNIDNTAYSDDVIMKRTYRLEPFHPLHVRTWKVWLYKKIQKKDFLRQDGSWLRSCEDFAMFFPMMEMAGKYMHVIQTPLSVYNCATFESEVKTNFVGLLKDEFIIRRKNIYDTIE